MKYLSHHLPLFRRHHEEFYKHLSSLCIIDELGPCGRVSIVVYTKGEFSVKDVPKFGKNHMLEIIRLVNHMKRVKKHTAHIAKTKQVDIDTMELLKNIYKHGVIDRDLENEFQEYDGYFINVDIRDLDAQLAPMLILYAHRYLLNSLRL